MNTNVNALVTSCYFYLLHYEWGFQIVFFDFFFKLQSERVFIHDLIQIEYMQSLREAMLRKNVTNTITYNLLVSFDMFS